MLPPSIYTLPLIKFVGGSTQPLLFYVYFNNVSSPFDLTGCTANFSVINFVNKEGSPLISKSMEIANGDTADDGTEMPNLLSVTLDPSDTKNLKGKYIYQITIKSSKGVVEIPDQGILYIENNINKAYVG